MGSNNMHELKELAKEWLDLKTTPYMLVFC